MPQYCDSYAGLLCTSVWVCVCTLYVCVYALLIYGAHFLKLVVKIKLFAKLDKKNGKKNFYLLACCIQIQIHTLHTLPTIFVVFFLLYFPFLLLFI